MILKGDYAILNEVFNVYTIQKVPYSDLDKKLNKTKRGFSDDEIFIISRKYTKSWNMLFRKQWGNCC